MAKFSSIRHLPKRGIVAYMKHEFKPEFPGDGDGFCVSKQGLLSRIDSLRKSGLDVSEEHKALSAIRKAEADAGRSILSQMANPWKPK